MPGGRRGRASPRGSAAVRALRPIDHRGAGRADARRPSAWIARGQFITGRRQQGYVGTGGLRDAMLSRVADSLYWMRRYVERADQIARVVGVNMDLAFDRAPLEVVQLWGRLLSGLWSAPAWAQVTRESPPDAFADLTNIDAVASCVGAARENARQIRQHITGEMWDRLNGVHLALNDPARRAEWSQRPHGFFQ